MGRKKIRNPYDGRKHVVTVRLKYWEHQELIAMASKLDRSVSDVCRMFMTQGVNRVNQAIAEDANDVNDDANDDAEVEVVKIMYKGKEYLKAGDNTIYDASSWDDLGRWDEKESKVIFDEDD